MSSTFPNLFRPLQLAHLTLKNRIVFGAHTANMSEGGLPGERHRGYYEERFQTTAPLVNHQHIHFGRVHEVSRFGGVLISFTK